MKTWTSLHNHSVYSMLDGLGKVDAYMGRAAELGMPGLAVTDHGNIHGWLDFYDASKEHGVKPILGIEAYQARKTRFDRDDEERAGKATSEFEQRGPYHLTLLAKSYTGYQNLIKLSSRAYLEGNYGKPRMDLELLAEHHGGVIALSGCLGGEVCQALLRDDYDAALTSAARMQDIFGAENYFIEVMNHGIPEEQKVLPDLLKIAKAIGAKPVITGDCHYVHQEQAFTHELMLCAGTGARITDEDRFRFDGDGFYLKSYEEMISDGAQAEWLDNTLEITDMVELSLEFDEFHFPSFPVPTEESEEEYFERLVWDGVRFRYGDDFSDGVRERTEHELRVIKKMGFPSYFLVVSDLVRWAKENGIRVGWGRGSAAGSIVSYVLQITNLDPLKFGLLFERFLVEGRKSMPDIDLDFDDRRRHEVIQYAREKYGEDRVAHIGTFGRVKAKTAIKDVARVFDYPFGVADRLNKMLPAPVMGVEFTIDESLQRSAEFRKEYESDEETRRIVDNAKGLEGVYRQTGVHAAGVVIAKDVITTYVPVMQRPDKNGDNGITVTQWDMNRVEQCGQLKVDFLGLTNLGTIDICVDTIKQRRGIEVDVDNIPLDDALTYERLCAGESMGTFQLESSGMRDMMVALQPNCIEDIMALVSLFRPGPLGSGMDKLFIARKHGRSTQKSNHPLMDELLKPTYGFMLYQEDVLSVSRNLAGFSAGEADDLRKAIGKKQMDKIGLFREKFVQGCQNTHQIDSTIANKIYSDIEYFGGYGFNLAHAASYAMVCYVTAYLKFHYPAEYMAALLTTTKNKAEAAKYLNECRNMGINVLPPSINRSQSEFTVESEEEILFGLSSVAGIGPAVVNAILSQRDQEYTSIYDFMRRCNPEVLNKATLEHLFRSGSFDEVVPDQKDRVLSRDEKMEMLDMERYELGLYITEHPLTGVWHTIEPDTTISISELDRTSDGETVVIGGLISQATKKTTRRGDEMYILEFEDMTGSVSVMVFPNAVKGNTFAEGEIALITGRVAHEGDEERKIYKVFFSEITRPEVPQYGTGNPIIIHCTTQPAYDTIVGMAELIDANPGDCPVYVQYLESDIPISLRFKRPASNSIRQYLLEKGS